MNDRMYANPVVKENLARLVARGHTVLEPGYGELACHTEGQGRLPDAPEIAEEIETILTPKDLCEERILVTAGPTQEPFDPVRYITNYSSGKMGYALAVMARRRGAAVTLISGPTALSAPRGVEFIPVKTARRDARCRHGRFEAGNGRDQGRRRVRLPARGPLATKIKKGTGR